MSSLSDVEKRYFEKLFGMSSGWVLDYTDATFGEFFNRHRISIHGPRYQTYGSSKAKKLRAFWENEPDPLVGKVLAEMLASYEAGCTLDGRAPDAPVLAKSREIAARLAGTSASPKVEPSLDEFMRGEFVLPDVQKLPIEQTFVPVIQQRLDEVRKALNAGAHLSVVLLCGSVLEAVLLGAAQRQPAPFNQAIGSPKGRDGAVRRFHEWSLTQLIDTACEIGMLKPDVKAFSHGLRDFRNYIHPFQQAASRFMPDQHTAKVCLQVLKAALASVAGERR